MGVENLREVEAAIGRIKQRVGLVSRMTVARAADMAETEIKKNFDGAHRKGEPHVGGNKPNVVTGTLRRSVGHTQLEAWGDHGWQTKVGPSVVYARRIELGYPGGSGRGHARTRAFPFVRPGVEKVFSALDGIAADTWREFIAMSRG